MSRYLSHNVRNGIRIEKSIETYLAIYLLQDFQGEGLRKQLHIYRDLYHLQSFKGESPITIYILQDSRVYGLSIL